ncbi:hypothetical protein CPB83DRAFT_851894 [Crepidotus variabilis]|uniref:DUF6534 domain-containing protein n=1 Tax=Crepidotus variabilis TaxID=179855 RepID=A0A9P6JRX0_9AGAR|nr:hypothetical protein CPB83DRAFT_851894 [Crepidotus variabilis]
MGFIDLSRLGPAEVAHGWMFIGLAINILLLGIMVIQTYQYYINYKNDRLWLKLFVGFLLVGDIFNTAFDAAYLYETLIVNFGNLDALAKATWLFACEPATTAIIVLAVQLFFAWRVFIVTETRVWSVLIVALALTGAVTGITTAVDVMRIPLFTQFQEFKPVVAVWMVSEVAADIISTSILVWYLRNHKSGLERSDKIVDKIIRFTVQTGLITFIFASFHLAFYLSDESGLHLLFNFPICKLYSNSVLSSLNSRFSWKFGNNAGSESQGRITSTGNFAVAGRANKNSEALNIEHHSSPEVYIHVESHELHDRQVLSDSKMHPSEWSAV